MSTTTPTFGVRMDDRNYPSIGSTANDSFPDAPEVLDDSSPKKLRHNLADAIQTNLPFLTVTNDSNDKSILFAQYVDSVSILHRYREEIFQLFRAMIETALEFDTEEAVSPQVRAEILAEIMKDVNVHISQSDNLATAEMGALQPREIRARLRANLGNSTKKLVAELLDALDVLVDQSVAGLVHWTSANTVKYNFFRRSAEITGVQHSRKRGRVQRRTRVESLADSRKWKRVNNRKTTTQVTCRLAHHKHDTVDAIHTSIENSKVTMPSFVQALVREIPDWMRSEITVIDGYLIREQIFERDLCSQEITEVTLEEELLHGHEPAVCLGPYVLTGWGPREIAAELETREQQTTGATQARSARFWGTLAVACQVFCVLFAQLGISALSVPLFVASIGGMVLWLSQAANIANLQLSEWATQRISFGFIALLGGIQLIFTPVSFSLVLSGIGCIIIGGAILSIDRGVLSQLTKSGG